MKNTATILTIAASLELAIATLSAAEVGPFVQNRKLRHSINLRLDQAQPTHAQFRAIKDAGFTAVRLAMYPGGHSAKLPSALSDEFLDGVDDAIAGARGAGLAAIVDFHDVQAMARDPQGNRERFLTIWRQVALRFQAQPDDVLFELLNEPHDQLTPDLWNGLLAEAIGVIRQSNPLRTIIVGSAKWSSIEGLPELRLPEEDRNLIVTVHYYQPHEFTHQGASWTWKPYPRGRKWPASADEPAQVVEDLSRAARWAREHRRPLFLGEYGAIKLADNESRVRWTRQVSTEADRLGMSRAYWLFCRGGFDVYDPQTDSWNKPLLAAILAKDPPTAAPGASSLGAEASQANARQTCGLPAGEGFGTQRETPSQQRVKP